MTLVYPRRGWKPGPRDLRQAEIDRSANRQASSIKVVTAAIVLCLLFQLHLVWAQPINWDEFRFLADIHAHSRGELSAVFLTFQVHLFGWLTGIGNEIVQIRIARLVMLALEIGTLSLIWIIARRFFDPAAALFGALAYLSFSFVLQHGASFRFDPITTFLVMLAIALLLVERLRWSAMAAVGLTLAVATMVTVKVVLAFPLLAAVAIYRMTLADDRRRAFLHLAFAAVAGGLFLALLYMWHLSTLSDASSGGAQQHLSASFSKTLVEIPFLPQRRYLMRALLENPLHWLLLLLGISAIVGTYSKDRARALLLLAFLLPLLSIGFYRNAFPYYYAFVLAPASVLFAAAADRAELRRLVGPMSLLITGGAFVHHQLALSPAAENQQRTIEAVHAIFPRPVPYLDHGSMIASFPQSGFFQSTLMMQIYRDEGRPVLRERIVQHRPVFVIANSPFLIRALEGRSAGTGLSFLPSDQAILRENYVWHWGPIYVAGKTLRLEASDSKVEILVPGPYTLESRAPVVINGRSYRPGDVIELTVGEHAIRSSSGAQPAVLRWGKRLDRPAVALTSGPLYGRF